MITFYSTHGKYRMGEVKERSWLIGTYTLIADLRQDASSGLRGKLRHATSCAGLEYRQKQRGIVKALKPPFERNRRWVSRLFNSRRDCLHPFFYQQSIIICPQP